MIEKVTNIIRKLIDKKGYVDLRVDVEPSINKKALNQIIDNLRGEGYTIQTETDDNQQVVKLIGKRIRGRFPWGK